MLNEFDKNKNKRERMVREQIIARGIKDKRVIEAMINVPREKFVPDSIVERAFEDAPLPLGSGQTISQPYIVAFMTELLELKGEEKVLEIGTGSGYQTAVLSQLCEKIISIERIKPLFDVAYNLLMNILKLKNVILLWSDGSLGANMYGLFDRIIVTAAAPKIPETLLNQLNDSGILVAPVGNKQIQMLEIWRREKNKFKRQESIPVVFVPLIGKYGWTE